MLKKLKNFAMDEISQCVCGLKVFFFLVSNMLLFFPDFTTCMRNIELTLHWEEISHVHYGDCPKLYLSESSPNHIEAYDHGCPTIDMLKTSC